MALDVRVSEKGAVSVYWLNRFPVTLYAEEWKKVFSVRKLLLHFIGINHDRTKCRCESDIRDELARLTQSGEISSGSQTGELWCRVGPSGAVSLYGVRRQFPITLYCDQWIRLLVAQDQIDAFIEDNREHLNKRGAIMSSPRVSAGLRPAHEVVGPDNIIRPARPQAS